MTAGEPPKVMREMLGHVSITLTLDTYSHVLPAMLNAAVAPIKALLYPAIAPDRDRRGRARAAKH